MNRNAAQPAAAVSLPAAVPAMAPPDKRTGPGVTTPQSRIGKDSTTADEAKATVHARRCFTWRTVHACGCGTPADCQLAMPLPVHAEQPCRGEFTRRMAPMLQEGRVMMRDCPRCGTALDPDGSCLGCGTYDPGPLPMSFVIDESHGAGLLDEVHTFLRGYVASPPPCRGAATLWAAHTHLAAAFESTPRLALLSPEKQCGKSRVLELLELLSAGAETLSDASPAYLYRRIGAGKVTILLDEADAIWKRGKTDETAEALRSIVNAGHRRTATVGRVEMNGTTARLIRFRVYAPAAIAGIGTLPDTILDRAVVIRMRRRAPDERIRDYRERTTRPEGDALRELLIKWAADVADWVAIPGLTCRQAAPTGRPMCGNRCS